MSDESFQKHVESLVAANRRFADGFDEADLQVEPKLHLAIVACMDSRMDLFSMLGLNNGEAHCIRNAGGVVTDDVIRSLCLSQRKLGTREIVLVHHTDCGLQKIEEGPFREELEAEFGVTPPWVIEAFRDPYADVRQSMQRLLITPFIAYKEHIRGFVYDVTTGLLNEVEKAPAASS